MLLQKQTREGSSPASGSVLLAQPAWNSLSLSLSVSLCLCLSLSLSVFLKNKINTHLKRERESIAEKGGYEPALVLAGMGPW